MKNPTGVIAVFKDQVDLLRAAKHGYDQLHLRKYDAFTPFPVHGLDAAMGVKRSWIPWVTFFAGLTGATAALTFEIWTSAVDWPINIGGKPFDSLPAFIPITFELTVLIGGLCTLAALLYACGLPNYDRKIIHPAATNDKFVLWIPTDEEGYDEKKVVDFFKGLHAEEVSVVKE